jgi:hypothetical protein
MRPLKEAAAATKLGIVGALSAVVLLSIAANSVLMQQRRCSVTTAGECVKVAKHHLSCPFGEKQKAGVAFPQQSYAAYGWHPQAVRVAAACTAGQDEQLFTFARLAAGAARCAYCFTCLFQLQQLALAFVCSVQAAAGLHNMGYAGNCLSTRGDPAGCSPP